MSEAYLSLEAKLRPLADPLPRPRPGDWLAEHDEPGQTFAEYLDTRPVRKGDKLHTKEQRSPNRSAGLRPALPGKAPPRS